MDQHQVLDGLEAHRDRSKGVLVRFLVPDETIVSGHGSAAQDRSTPAKRLAAGKACAGICQRMIWDRLRLLP